MWLNGFQGKTKRAVVFSDKYSASSRSQVNWTLLKNTYTESNMPQNYFFTIFLQNISQDYQTT